MSGVAQDLGTPCIRWTAYDCNKLEYYIFYENYKIFLHLKHIIFDG